MVCRNQSIEKHCIKLLKFLVAFSFDCQPSPKLLFRILKLMWNQLLSLFMNLEANFLTSSALEGRMRPLIHTESTRLIFRLHRQSILMPYFPSQSFNHFVCSRMTFVGCQQKSFPQRGWDINPVVPHWLYIWQSRKWVCDIKDCPL